MKKAIFLFLLILPIFAAAQNLEFNAVGGGKFIYCNNPEAITEDILANGENPSYIMNNEALEAGNYYLYLSHVNRTNGDVELDVEITAKEDTSFVINNLQFSTGRALKYRDESGTEIPYENDWGYLDVCAGMLGAPIITIDGADLYTGIPFEAVTVELKKGETVWLGSYPENYMTTHMNMPVHMQAELEILSGKANINVLAFKHNGVTGDRTDFEPEKTAFGAYRRDRCLKGVADTLPQVVAELEYVIDETTEFLPVTVNNQYTDRTNEPVVTEKWCTNLNPQDDIWSKYITAENDMLPLFYKDDAKLSFYAEGVTDKNNVWVFDTRHSDTKHYESAFGVNPAQYEPNFILDVSKDNQGFGCSMGNYGVTTTYKLKIENKCDSARWFEYMPTTGSNIIAYISDGGKPEYAMAKQLSIPAKTDYMVSRKLEPGEITEFCLNVILPVNYNGGIQNTFAISSENHSPDYDTLLENRTEKELYDDKDYLVNYKEQMTEETVGIFDRNMESYEVVGNGTHYMARWCAWDGLVNYYSDSWEKVSSIYVTDDNFNTVTAMEFDSIPVGLKCINGVFYIKTKAGEVFASDGKNKWKTDAIREEIAFKLNNISDWARNDIAKMLSDGLIPDGIFDGGADEYCTRKQFCSLIFKYLKLSHDGTESAFTDTDDIACNALNEAGIVLGVGNGLFMPDKSVTRQEAAVILMRTADYLGLEVESTDYEYKDFDSVAPWAKEAVSHITALNIMNGVGDDTFMPEGVFTNEQAIVTVHRFKSLQSKLNELPYGIN